MFQTILVYLAGALESQDRCGVVDADISQAKVWGSGGSSLEGVRQVGRWPHNQPQFTSKRLSFMLKWVASTTAEKKYVSNSHGST